MERQTLLLSLPVSLAADLLNSWLLVPDRVRLDSVYCNHEVRPSFLKLICSPECTVQSLVYHKGRGKATNDIIAWANARGVLVEKISIGPSSDLDVFESYLQKFGSSVTTVILHRTSCRALNILTQCTNLTKLDIMMCEISPTLGEVLRQSPKLRELRVFFNGHNSPRPADTLTSADLQGIAYSSLKVLTLTRCKDPAVVAALVKSAVNVDTLALYKCDTDGALHADILENVSPAVTVLSLAQVCSFPEDAFVAMVERCVHIVHLDLCGSVVSVGMAAAIGTLRLSSVGLSYSNITDDVLLTVLDAQRTSLTEVLLGRVSLEVMHNTLQNCTKLSTFNAQCIDEDDYSLDLSVCKMLTSLSVIYQGDRQGQFLAQISEHCTSLQTLQLNLSKIDFRVEQIDTILEHCTLLCELALDVRISDDIYIEQNEERWQGMRPGVAVTSIYTAALTAMNKLEQYE